MLKSVICLYFSLTECLSSPVWSFSPSPPITWLKNSINTARSWNFWISVDCIIVKCGCFLTITLLFLPIMAALCEQCGKSYAHKKNLKRHIKSVHGISRALCCVVCKAKFSREDNLYRHFGRHHMVELKEASSAMSVMIKWLVVSPLKCMDEKTFLENSKAIIIYHLQRLFKSHQVKSIMLWSSLEVEMKKITGDTCTAHFCHKNMIICRGMNFNFLLHKVNEEIQGNLQKYQEMGSGWEVDSVNHLDLHVVTRDTL